MKVLALFAAASVGLFACGNQTSPGPAATSTTSASSTPPASTAAPPLSTTSAAATPAAKADAPPWAWLDGAPDPDVKLKGDILGDWSFSLHVPERWFANRALGCNGPGDPGCFDMGAAFAPPGRSPETPGQAWLLAYKVGLTHDRLDEILTGRLKAAMAARDIDWQPREPAKLGADHLDVKVAKGTNKAGDWEYWQIVVPAASGLEKWVAAGIKKDADPEIRKALTASLRSIARK